MASRWNWPIKPPEREKAGALFTPKFKEDEHKISGYRSNIPCPTRCREKTLLETMVSHYEALKQKGFSNQANIYLKMIGEYCINESKEIELEK